MARPDALFLPISAKQGDTMARRVRAVSTIAEPLLEVDYKGGERAIIREQGQQGRLFITRDASDTILFPAGHPRAGQPRYRWEPGPDGAELGWLND
jgi:hypothetical protein